VGRFHQEAGGPGAVVDELLKGIGGRLISIYYTTGEWDELVIYEVPDANVAMAVLMAILAPGHLMETQTCMLYTMKDMIKAPETAKALKFRGIAGELPSAPSRSTFIITSSKAAGTQPRSARSGGKDLPSKASLS
jgi:uncharacterized protein with GYD domain